eukprot:22149-Pelagococcus_subviridis.AAC.1
MSLDGVLDTSFFPENVDPERSAASEFCRCAWFIAADVAGSYTTRVCADGVAIPDAFGTADANCRSMASCAASAFVCAAATCACWCTAA